MTDFTPSITDRYYGMPHPVGGGEIHPILRCNVFYGCGSKPAAGRPVILFTNLSGFIQTSLGTSITSAQYPQQQFLQKGWALVWATLPVARGGSSPLAVSDGSFDPGSDLFGDAYRGNGCHPQFSGDDDGWPSTNPTSNPLHPAVDPEWLAASFAFMQLVQHVRDNATELGIDPDRIVVFGDSAGATAACYPLLQPDRAGKYSATGQGAVSTRVAGGLLTRPMAYIACMDQDNPPGPNAYERPKSGEPEPDVPAADYDEVAPAIQFVGSPAQYGAMDTANYPDLVDDNNALAIWIRVSQPMSAAALALSTRYTPFFPVETETDPHSALHAYILKSLLSNVRLVVSSAAEDPDASTVPNGLNADAVINGANPQWDDAVTFFHDRFGVTTMPTPRFRDTEGGLQAAAYDRLMEKVKIVVHGSRYDSSMFDPYTVMEVQMDVDEVPLSSVSSGSGQIIFDVFDSLIDPASPDRYDVAQITRSMDDLCTAFERTNIPIFDLTDFDSSARSTGSLSTAIGVSETTIVVTGGASFGPGPMELTIGSERITYTSKVDAGQDATFSGCVRGIGKTNAASHPAGAPVADNLGQIIAFAECMGADRRSFGFDAGRQRNTARVVIPFLLKYSDGNE